MKMRHWLGVCAVSALALVACDRKVDRTTDLDTVDRANTIQAEEDRTDYGDGSLGGGAISTQSPTYRDSGTEERGEVVNRNDVENQNADRPKREAQEESPMDGSGNYKRNQTPDNTSSEPDPDQL